MTTHDAFLDLASTAIDFRLAAEDRLQLEQHLAQCPACRRRASALRADALAIAGLPRTTLPHRRADEILAAALHPATARHPVRLLLVAAILALLALGSLAAGAELLRRLEQEDLGVVPPAPSVAVPFASPPASPPAVAPPSGVPAPSQAPGAPAPAGTLAVTRGEPPDTWVELVPAAGGEASPLGLGADPSWFTDGRLVYGCAKELGQNTTICLVDPDQELQPEIAGNARRPAPAPDGRSIAVLRGTIDVGETWVMATDGSNARRLHAGRFLSWSPDGAWLVGQPEGAAAEVAIVGADGAGYRVLAPGFDPTWAPAGNRITYALVEDDGSASIRSVFLADGSIEVLVTAPAGVELGAPSWLPDGRLLYVQDGDIWVFDPRGAPLLRVTSSGSVVAGGDAGPLAPSPDGRWVAYTEGSGATAAVAISSVDGLQRVTFPGDGAASQPRWAPAGASLGASVTEALGTTWSGASWPAAVGVPEGRVEAVTTGPNGFLAVGRGCLMTDDPPACEGIVWRSADGSGWERVPTSRALDIGAVFPTSGPELGMFDVASGGPGFVAIGYAARPAMQATAWFSPDGLEWARFPLGDAGTTRVNAVGWDGRRFLIVGEDRSDWDGTLAGMGAATARAAVWASPDGRTWVRLPHQPGFDVGGFIDTMEDPSTGGMADIVIGPDQTVVVGSSCVSTGECEPAIWLVPFGDSGAWERVPGPEGATGRLLSVAASGSAYVAAGWGQAALLQSADGRSWQLQPSPASDPEGVVRVGDRFLLVASVDRPGIWASQNGSEWVDLDPEGGPSVAQGASPSDWSFAANDSTAVWLDAGAMQAWVSRTAPTP